MLQHGLVQRPVRRLIIVVLCAVAVGGSALVGWFIPGLELEAFDSDMLIVSLLGITVAALLLRYPEIGIALFLYNGIFKTSSVFGDPNSPFPTLFILGLMIVGFIIQGRAGRRQWLRIDGLIILIAMLNLLMLLSAFFVSGSSSGQEKALRLTFFTTTLFVAVAFMAHSPDRLLRVFRSLAGLSIITAVMTLISFAMTGSIYVRQVTLFEANDVVFGRALALGITMGIGLVLHDHTLTKPWRRILVFGLPASIFALILSTARGSIIGLVVAVAAALVMERARIPGRGWLITGLTGLTVYFGLTAWGGRVTDLRYYTVFAQGGYDPSIDHRLIYYRGAYDKFLDSPLWGVGPQAGYAHNIFLEVASELGILGLGVLLLLLWEVLLRARRITRVCREGSARIVARLIVMGLLYSFAIAQFSGNLQNQRALWVFVALTWAWYSSHLRVRPRESSPRSSPTQMGLGVSTQVAMNLGMD